MIIVFPQKGNKKKVSATEFNGILLVHIRLFYDDKTSGEEKPGHTGISLTVEQWKKLKENVTICIVHFSRL